MVSDGEAIEAIGRKADGLFAAGRFAEAELICRQILAADPRHRAARCTLAKEHLARSDWTEGWRLYEARRELPELRIPSPRLNFPEWNGSSDIASLLVFCEQGLGDQIMFARWIPELSARGISVTLLADPRLVRLFGCFGVQVVPAAGEVQLPGADAWCLIGSLPHLLGTMPSAPYLPGAGAGRGVGVMSRGNPVHTNDANRSLPPHLADELLTLGRSLAPEATGARDLQDTAEIIAGLSLVVSVDTSVAHLSGAMGKPTVLLLPAPSEWRWGRTGERTRWYPSVRMLRQPAPGDWASVLHELRAILAAPGGDTGGQQDDHAARRP